MPTSSPLCKKDMIEWIIKNIPKDARILDVGPGMGTYSEILTPLGYKTIDAVEIYAPYVTKYSLEDKYNNVYIGNVLEFKFPKGFYQFVILGDVLEHMSREAAQQLLSSLFEKVDAIIISVPYNNTQGTYDGNVYESHLQNDLNAETFKKIYPEFTLISDQEDKSRHNDIGQWEHITAWVWKKCSQE